MSADSYAHISAGVRLMSSTHVHSRSSTRTNFSRIGCSSGPDNCAAENRNGKPTHKPAASLADSGTRAIGRSLGSRYSKTSSSKSKRRVKLASLSSETKLSSASESAKILPLSMTFHPQRVPKQITTDPSSCSFLNTNNAFSRVIIPPYLQRMLGLLSKRLDQRMQAHDRATLLQLRLRHFTP